MKVYSQLEKAQLENLASDPTPGYGGRVIFNTTTKKARLDNGTLITALGGGGSGSGLVWHNDYELAWGEETNYGQKTYTAQPGATIGDQKLWTAIKVPNDFSVGTQIKLKGKFFSNVGSGNVLLNTITTLIRSGSDALSSVTYQYTSTNTAVTVDTVDKEYIVDWDLTSAIGQIGGTPVNVNPNDTILIYLTRSADTNTGDVKFMPTISEVLI